MYKMTNNLWSKLFWIQSNSEEKGYWWLIRQEGCIKRSTSSRIVPHGSKIIDAFLEQIIISVTASEWRISETELRNNVIIYITRNGNK